MEKEIWEQPEVIRRAEAPGNFDEEVRLPKTSPWVAPLLHLLAGQLLAYETALVLGRNIDRPRSLAKSVTVA